MQSPKLSSRALFSLSPVALLAIFAFATVPDALADAELLITEINYHPLTASENWEFIEIKNVGGEPQDMQDYTFGGIGGKVTFSNQTVIPAGGFMVLAKNVEAFRVRYGLLPGSTDNGVLPGGTFSGGLSNKGEQIEIIDGEGVSVFSVDYWDGGNEDPADPEDDARPLWPSNPDDLGYTLVPQNPNVNTDPNDYRNWRPSINVNGSPGADEPLPPGLLPVFINEVRTRDGNNANDGIEIFNPNSTDVNIGGWLVLGNLDDSANPAASKVPAGTIVPAGGYIVFENGVNSISLSLSSRGGRVFLYSVDGLGNLTGYVHGLHFGASGDGKTFSRYENSVGTEQFPAAENTLDSANAAPIVGPVVITEVMYSPGELGGGDLGDLDEFVEMKNISDAVVKLYDPLRTTNNWRLEGANYILGGAQPTLAPGEIALITKRAPATFRAEHNVPAGIQIFGPYTGSLNNGGEEVALQRPEQTSYINADVVLYDNAAPWPLEADGRGRSLVRIDPTAYGNDPSNWQASLLLGGSAGLIYEYSGPEIFVNEVLAHTDIAVGSQQVNVIELYNPTGAVVNIGNWWLSNDKDDPKLFQIPAGTMIPAGGFWAVNQDNDAIEDNGAPAGYFGNANALQISSSGDSIHLFSADGAGELTGYRHGFKFRATVNGSRSLGRYVDSFGRDHFTKQVLSFEVNRAAPNPAGAANNPPIVGPVVISEIHYDPSPGGVEFIELKNITANAVPLYTPNTVDTWSLDGVTFSFPGQPLLAANGIVVILPKGENADIFRDTFDVPAEVDIFGGEVGYVGFLNNGGEEIVLLPDKPNIDGVPRIAVDVVNYQDSDFWPAVGGGRSLEKFNLSGFSDDPINWRASTASDGTPGTIPGGLTYDNWSLQNFTAAELAQPGLTGCDDDMNGDGLANIFAYGFGYDPHVTPGEGLLPVGGVVDVSGTDFYAISYRRLTAPNELTYTVEYSSDLSTWMQSLEQIGVVDDNGDGTETVQFHSGTPVSAQGGLFMRLRLSKG